MASESKDAKPAISLPKGGGAIKGIGETFQANPFTGTGDFSLPIAVSPGRNGFEPKLTLSYSSGNGNGPFGLGWQLAVPRVTRKTEKGLPTYTSEDVFVLSGAEDLVPQLQQVAEDTSDWQPVVQERDGFRIAFFRPRTEGLFARIERWTRSADGDVHWRSITRDNVTSIYGRGPGARIADPDRSDRVYEWLLEETFDRRGNHVFYEYVQEHPEVQRPGLPERNRRPSQTYLRRILYGNTPDDLGPGRRAGLTRHGTDHENPLQTRERHYVFEVLFDYGDLPEPLAIPGRFPTQEERLIPPDWPVREDPFSSFRARFEIRTLRRCRRVLMLHHFDEPEVDGAPLVKSTDFDYRIDPRTSLSFLESVTVRGHRRDPNELSTYLVRRFPPATFKYSEFGPHKQRYQSLIADGGDLPPESLNSPDFALMDIFGNGLPDVVQAANTGFHYWRNRGGGHFGRRSTMSASPPVTLSRGGVFLADMGGDGLPDLVVEDPPLSGFFEATPDGGWKPFRSFERMPVLGLADPDTRLVDLTGDGLSDVLSTRQDAFLWYRSLGEIGYAEPRRIPRRHDLDEFPDVFFSDPAGRVRLADMSGDGLEDIVLLHDGRIEYWPNLGYGNFGPRITMANAPRIGHDFDPSRLFLADIDGTGCADLVYVDVDEVHFWFNQSGNAWSRRETITGTPRVNDAADVRFADVYGTGTAALMWSYGAGEQRESNYKVLDFCGARKPHLLVEMSNNLGAVTRVHYASSTKFFLEDQEAGKPWATSLPFPVHVLEETEVIDRISRTKFVTRYKYHHGYYDATEREFRGFGMVEQFDTEHFAALESSGDFSAANIDAASHVPPVHTKTLFHTGAFLDRHHISRQFENEYYREPGLSDAEFREQLLPDTTLPDDLASGEEREACRVLRGSILRQEVYALDGTEKQPHPYSVSERDYTVKRLQPRHKNNRGVFFAHPRETIDYNYERRPADPRIGHTLTLEVDAFGNTLKVAAVAYGRRVPDPSLSVADSQKQTRTLVTYTETGFTNAIDTAGDYRTPLPCETREYELTGYEPSDPSGRFRFGDLVEPNPESPQAFVHIFDSEIAYEEKPATGRQRRLMEHGRTLYRPDDLGAASTNPMALLPLCVIEPLAVPGEMYRLAFTPGLLEEVFQRNGEALLPDVATVLGGCTADGCGYVDLDNNGHWWIPSGRTFFSPGSADTSAQESAFARKHFFLPHRTRDPFHTDAFRMESFITYDRYDLLMLDTRDALDNRVTAGERTPAGDIDPNAPGNDYRVLQPRVVMDPNRNRTAAVFDALGMVVGVALMGKPEEKLGDALDGFVADLPDTVMLAHLDNPVAAPHDIVGHATSRLVYDLFAYRRTQDLPSPQPAVVYTLARETHDADLAPGQQTRIQHSFSYSDGPRARDPAEGAGGARARAGAQHRWRDHHRSGR